MLWVVFLTWCPVWVLPKWPVTTTLGPLLLSMAISRCQKPWEHHFTLPATHLPSHNNKSPTHKTFHHLTRQRPMRAPCEPTFSFGHSHQPHPFEVKSHSHQPHRESHSIQNRTLNSLAQEEEHRESHKTVTLARPLSPASLRGCLASRAFLCLASRAFPSGQEKDSPTPCLPQAWGKPLRKGALVLV